jgi:DNA invertase Pin-like site-specific DNA recombinase
MAPKRLRGVPEAPPSLRNLIDTITAINERGVGFKSLQENIDTTTSGASSFFISLAL